MDAAVDALMEFAGEEDDVRTAVSETFIQSLSQAELKKVVDFLSGNEDPAKTVLQKQLIALRTEIDGTAPAETTSETPVGKILSAIDKGIERLGFEGKMNQFAAKLGFKGDVGPKQVVFLKNMLVGFAARAVEGMIMAIKRINPTMDISSMMNTSLELRLISIIDSKQREKYKEAYLAWAKNPTTPNPPTLQEIMNPLVAATPTQAPTETPAAQQTPEAPVTVESSSIVNFPDRTSNLEIVRTEGKITLTTDGKKADMKVENLQTIAVRAPKEGDTGIIEMKLADGKTVTTEPAVLRNAVRDEAIELLASDNTTKISLTKIPTV